MPTHPQLGDLTRDIDASVFSALVSRLGTVSGETFPLHVGDTWREPPTAARMESLDTATNPGLHRYAPPAGWQPLRDTLLDLENARGTAREPSDLLVTAGATSGLHCTCSVLLDPGDEVLVLAPFWPLIAGIVRACRGVPVAVDVLDLLDGERTDADAIVGELERHLGPRTSVLYVSSPNNPTGRVLPRATLEALADWARRRNLWLISDEVYEHYAWARPHVPLAPLAPERTVTSFSFSKAYGLAGARCGYLTGPAGFIGEALKISTHSAYSTPTMGQVAALRSLLQGGEWLSESADLYRRAGRRAAAVLGVDPPEGGTFLFLDLAEALHTQGRDGTILGFLEACADRGLLLAPGPSFGAYPTCARFCFTCLDPERTERGALLLAELLGRGPGGAGGDPSGKTLENTP